MYPINCAADYSVDIDTNVPRFDTCKMSDRPREERLREIWPTNYQPHVMTNPGF